MQHENIILVGTSHIAKQSLKEIEKKIINENPGIIAVELDPRRLNALLSEEKHKLKLSDIRHIGVKGYIFAQLGGWMQRKLGNIVGVAPGSEMKLAVKMAQERKLRVALIDQDIEITLQKLSKQLTWKEKWHFFADLVRGLLFPKKEIEKYGMTEFDLTTVPSKKLIKKMMEHVKERYPNLYDVLVAQRNEIMAKRLFALSKQNTDKTILAVVGAGHEEDIISILKRLEKTAHAVSKAA
jgi:pheromone shutdown-related protein TraB